MSFTPWQPQRPFVNLPTTARTVRTVSKSNGTKEDKHDSSTMVDSEGRPCKPSKHDTTLMGRTLNVLPKKHSRLGQPKDIPVQGLQECLAYGQQPFGTALVQPVYKFNGVDGYQLHAYTTVYYLNGTWQPWLVCEPNKEDIAFMTRGLNKWGTPYDFQAAPDDAAVMDNSETAGLRGRTEDPIIVPAREVQAHLKVGHGRQLEPPRLDSTTTDKSSGGRRKLRYTEASDLNGARLIRGPVGKRLDELVGNFRGDSQDAVADDLQSDADSDATTKIAYEDPLRLTKDFTPDLIPTRMDNEDSLAICGEYDSDATAKPDRARRDLPRYPSHEDLDNHEFSGRRMITNGSIDEVYSDAGSSSSSEDEDYDDDGSSYGMHAEEPVDNIGDDESASDDDAPPHEFSYEELLPYRNTGWLHVAPYLRYPDYELQSEIRNVRGRLPESSLRGLER
ncbi:hypothetical protein PLEOSDRAFT_1105238 [Pleurotus ostreatus PC15]|uniref:Uncharacterized protein n=1 Tax=Pleurotus ostreatus (strain PC15) TaxID=1137138 RepID=A0A067NEV4_PLEO1|nr:hypothetical protein PLEOSDRAFT_1105238 [Pleurotus ostreatus PC15]